jgi:hypothetical protein
MVMAIPMARDDERCGHEDPLGAPFGLLGHLDQPAGIFRSLGRDRHEGEKGPAADPEHGRDHVNGLEGEVPRVRLE